MFVAQGENTYWNLPGKWKSGFFLDRSYTTLEILRDTVEEDQLSDGFRSRFWKRMRWTSGYHCRYKRNSHVHVKKLDTKVRVRKRRTYSFCCWNRGGLGKERELAAKLVVWVGGFCGTHFVLHHVIAQIYLASRTSLVFLTPGDQTCTVSNNLLIN